MQHWGLAEGTGGGGVNPSLNTPFEGIGRLGGEGGERNGVADDGGKRVPEGVCTYGCEGPSVSPVVLWWSGLVVSDQRYCSVVSLFKLPSLGRRSTGPLTLFYIIMAWLLSWLLGSQTDPIVLHWLTSN